MKKELLILLILAVFLSGCTTTGFYATDACDKACEQEREAYNDKVDGLVAQAKQLALKIDEWKTVLNEDVKKMTVIQSQFSGLKMPYNYDVVHTYYGKGFTHYVEAINFAYKASEAYMMNVDVKDVQTSNMARSQIISYVNSAYNSRIRAEEEIKFASGIVAKINAES